MRRKVVATFAVIATLLVGWTATWHWLRDGVLETIATLQADLMADGSQFACDGRRLEGFPFRFDLRCDRTAFDDDGLSASAGPLHVAALAYRPNQLIAELGAPLEVALPGMPEPLVVGWTLAQASARVGLGVFRRASVAVDDLASAFGPSRVEAAHAEAHIRAEIAEDDGGASAMTRLALSARQMILEQADVIRLPPTDVLLTALVALPPAALAEDAVLIGGFDVPSFEARVETAEVSLFLHGPLSVGPDGLVDGTLVARARGLDDVPRLVRAAARGIGAERLASNFDAIGPVIAALGRDDSLDGKPARRVEIVIEDGWMRTGLMPLGRIPPLFGQPPA